MECHRLVPLLLLLGLLAGAAATTGAEAQSCEPTTLATQIALFCAPDMPTAPCCEPVVASVDLGGGVPCLCRVAAQPQLVLARLNASHLLALHTACGGLHIRGRAQPCHRLSRSVTACDLRRIAQGGGDTSPLPTKVHHPRLSPRLAASSQPARPLPRHC